ncbi:MAG TPA: pepsin-like aspartic protease, partial [Myxococcota bacterium]|nr:pepsin-like aspartic protease [Myxococcota bacterium]
ASPRYAPGPGATATGQQTSAVYGGGQGWRGPVYTDAVSLGHGIAPVRMKIAAISAQTVQRADAQPFLAPSRCSGAPVSNSQQGILGLGGPQAGAPNTDAYVASMVGATAGVFAVQMCDIDGRAWFGGYDPAYLEGVPMYTPLVDARDYYVVEVTDVRVDGVTAALTTTDFGLTLVDTGTSITLLPARAFDALSEIIEADPVFRRTFGEGFFTGGSCLGAPPDMDAAALDAALPRFTVVLPGKGNADVALDLPATESYLTPTRAPGGGVVYCPALALSTSASRAAATLLGSSLLHSHITIFDRPGMQVGFAPQRACAFLGH